MVQTIRPGIYMVQDDLNPPVDFQISNDDAVIDPITGDVITPATAYDLTGCTVKFYMKHIDGTVVNSGHPACAIVDAATGQARYTFQTGDTAKPGKYLCDVEVIDAVSKSQREYTVTELHVREKNG